MKRMLEPKNSNLTISYQPEGGPILENPPRFTWMPESNEDIEYRLQISTSEEFNESDTLSYTELPYNFYTLDHALLPGGYYWRYAALDPDFEYSSIRSFTMEAGLPETPLIGRAGRYENVDYSHPRIWMNQKGVEEFKRNLTIDGNYCNFKDFYEKSVLKYKGRAFVSEPEYYPANKKTVDRWRSNYTICQEALCYIRSLSVGGTFLEDEGMLEQAVKALLQLASWDTGGSTSRNYNDECAFRVAYALAFGFDWLYDKLNIEQRFQVLDSLYIRTKQVADHITLNSRIHFSLYDSHAVRSLSSVLTPCCIAMLHEHDDAEKWLNYTIEYFGILYTPWGNEDGGWAEGPLYWTTGMAFVTEALNTIKNFTGINFYERPFFQKTGDFPLYCNPIDTYRSSFCDQSNLGKYPGHKTAFNMRQFAGVTGNPNYYWYYQQVFKREPDIDPDFFNSGWWDFPYDEMVYQHDYGNVTFDDSVLIEPVKWFRDIGWVSIQIHPTHFENHIFLLTKSSPYGSVSHSHGDQNDFVLFAYGEPLAIRSGYYIGFNTSMHRDYRKRTKSHNTLLIDGRGQYDGMDKSLQLSAKGEILEVREDERRIYVKEDATAAYQHNVPELKSYQREIYVLEESYIVLIDTVATEKESEIQWLLHSLNQYEIGQDSFITNGQKAQLEGKFVYCSSDIVEITQSDVFDGVETKEIEHLPNQWHLTMKTGKKKKHVIVTLLTPTKRAERKLIIPIIDDQGHDIYIYFNYDGNTFSLKVDGEARYS